MQLDDLDRKTAEAFDGFLVRKDLVRTFSRQFPVPTYVVEFLLDARQGNAGAEVHGIGANLDDQQFGDAIERDEARCDGLSAAQMPAEICGASHPARCDFPGSNLPDRDRRFSAGWLSKRQADLVPNQ